MPRLCRRGIKGPAVDTCCGDGTTVGVDGAKLAYLSRACQRLQVLAGDHLTDCLPACCVHVCGRPVNHGHPARSLYLSTVLGSAAVDDVQNRGSADSVAQCIQRATVVRSPLTALLSCCR